MRGTANVDVDCALDQEVNYACINPRQPPLCVEINVCNVYSCEADTYTTSSVCSTPVFGLSDPMAGEAGKEGCLQNSTFGTY